MRAGALNDSVCHQGGAMNELLHTTRCDALPLECFKHEGFDSLGWIARRGERFANCESAASIIEYYKGCECASNIHPYPVMTGGTFHQSTSSLGKRLNGKISTWGDRCWDRRPPSTAKICPVI